MLSFKLTVQLQDKRQYSQRKDILNLDLSPKKGGCFYFDRNFHDKTMPMVAKMNANTPKKAKSMAS